MRLSTLRIPVTALLFLCAPISSFSAPEQIPTWKLQRDAAHEASESGEYEKAEDLFLTAIENARQAGVETSQLAPMLDELGDLYLGYEDYPGAEECYREALDLRVKQLGPNDIAVADSHSKLADLDWARRQMEQVEPRLLKALAIRREVAGEYHVDVVGTYIKLGRLYLEQGKSQGANDAFARALERREALLGTDHLDLVPTLQQIAAAYESQEAYDRADPLRERCLNLWEKAWGTGDPRFQNELWALASIHLFHERYQKAEELCRRFLEQARQESGEDSAPAARAHSGFGDVFFAQKNYRQAEIAYQRAIAIYERLEGNGGGLAAALEGLGRVLVEQNRKPAAVVAYERSIEIRVASGSSNDFGTNLLLNRLGALYRELGARDAAAAVYLQAAKIHEASEGERSFAAAWAWQTVGDLQMEMGDYREAGRHFNRARAHYYALYGQNDPRVIPILLKLADVNEKQRQHIEAARWRNRANGLATMAIAVRMQGVLKKFSRNKTLGFGAGALLLGVVLAGLSGTVFLSAVMSRRLAARLAPFTSDWGPPPSASEVLFPLESGAPAAFAMQPADPDVSSPPEPRPQRQLRFFGDGLTLLGIWVINLLLTLVTLGVYFFWGKVRIRRYIYTKISLDGEYFTYHGTAKELLIGWLRAVPFLAAIFWGPLALSLLWKSPYAEPVGRIVAFALIMVLWPLALAGAYRYRLSRTSWRGIRFSFRGRRREYLLLTLGGMVLWFGTLGLAYPIIDVWMRRYFVNESWFGNRRFQFDGRGRDLLWLFATAVPLTIATLGFYWFWYGAQRQRYCWSRTAVGGARFRCTLRGGDLCRVTITNFLLLIFTLGLAWPWTFIRKTRLMLDCIQLDGPVDFASIEQDSRAATATAEGFADFLGVDFGI